MYQSVIFLKANMQYTDDRNGLNRSYSESDLLRPYPFFNSPTRSSTSTISTTFVNNPEINNICNSSSHLFVRRSMVIEEVVPVNSQLRRPELRRFYSTEVIDANNSRNVYNMYESLVPSSPRKADFELSNIDANIANLQINKTDVHVPPNSNFEETAYNNTPMDIDECDSSASKRSTFNESVRPMRNLVVRKRQVISEVNEKISKNGNVLLNRNYLKKKKSSRFLLKSIIIVLVFLTGMYVIFSDDIHIYINNELDTEKLQKELLDLVHDQKGAVNTVITTLEYKNYWRTNTKLLGFIGPSGVGKTFVANVIKRNFLPKLVHEIYGSHLNNFLFRDQVLQNLKGCCFNLIIVDDLQKHDMAELLNFIYSLPKNTHILVIAMLNIKENDDKFKNSYKFDDLLKVKEELDNTGLYQDLIFFKPFTDSQVKVWLKKQLELRNVSSNMHNYVMRNALKGHDVANQGLKGLEKKVLLEIEKLM